MVTAREYKDITQPLFDAWRDTLKQLIDVRWELWNVIFALDGGFDTQEDSKRFYSAIQEQGRSNLSIAREFRISAQNIDKIRCVFEGAELILASFEEELVAAQTAFEQADKPLAGVRLSIMISDNPAHFSTNKDIQAIRDKYRDEIVALHDTDPTKWKNRPNKKKTRMPVIDCLIIEHDKWIEYEDHMGDFCVVPANEFDKRLADTSRGQSIDRKTGWSWHWFEDGEHHPNSEVFKTHEEAFNSAFTHFNCYPDIDYKEWVIYAAIHNLQSSVSVVREAFLNANKGANNEQLR